MKILSSENQNLENNSFTLAFAGELEKDFYDLYYKNSLRHVRLSLLLAIFIYGLFGILDYWIVPEVIEDLWLIRFAFFTPYVFAVYLFSFSRHFKKYMQFSIFTVVLLAGIGIIAMILIAPYPVSHSYYAGLILVFLYGYTFFKLRFVWATLASMVLVIATFPILTATIGMLSSDRLLGTHIFTSEFGGNPMMFINLIWAWGHPEVYILVLPMFGVYSEIVPVFSSKRLFGYPSMVWAIVAITVLSVIVWLHHFFTMGAGANVNAFFGIMTMVIAVPTGVKVFNWLFTMYRGRVRFTTPMLWFLGFAVTFTIGGMTGVMLAVPAIDFQVHNSLFLVAHFHNVIIGGFVFGFFAAYSYWFPKFTGFRLNERLGKYAFWSWIIGFVLAFVPLYLLGFMGATRRLNHYDAATGWQPLFIVAAIGAVIILIGVGLQVLQLYVSIRDRNDNRETAGDPWNGRTLEWSTVSPPPFYNFAFTPEVKERDPFWAAKQRNDPKVEKVYKPIHMPKNTSAGFFIGLFSCIMGFALVWHMFWLAAIAVIGMIVTMIARLYVKETDYYVTAEAVETIETKRQLT